MSAKIISDNRFRIKSAEERGNLANCAVVAGESARPGIVTGESARPEIVTGEIARPRIVTGKSRMAA